MKVTAVHRVYNETQFTWRVINHETPSDTKGDRGLIPPYAEKDVYFWVPWATKRADFRSHHVELIGSGDDGTESGRFFLWQHDDYADDKVRFDRIGWNPHGEWVRGEPNGGGERVMTILAKNEDGIALNVYKRPAPPPPLPSTGVTLFRQSDGTYEGSTFRYEGVIRSVENTVSQTVSISGERRTVHYGFRVRLVDANDNSATTDMLPSERVTDPLRGLLVEGKWTGQLIDPLPTPKALGPDTATLRVEYEVLK
ncbi:hypothetical protein [Motilibacter deserti]|uniref:Cadherin domain-containing protein n=1 Tax=Motilibacter deserti TaxID=2714956 RepID=A0ABX0GTV1_9ACTN|nr:hypothetical protein [Motilibacter deserti]NHC14321.1 hypothetical protein [Motilibacter deserti]